MYIIQDACIFYQWYFHIIKADNVHFLYNKYLIAAFCQTSGSIYDIFRTIQELRKDRDHIIKIPRPGFKQHNK